MATRIDSKTARDALKPRREPYWLKVVSGLHVGYRRPATGEGTWIARRTEGAAKTYRALGQFFDDERKPGASSALDKAKAQARAWAGQIESGIVVHDTTVEDACKAYVKRLRTEKGDASAKDAEGRFKRLVYGKPFGRIPLQKLTTIGLREWRDAQVPADPDDDEALRRAKDSVNRNLASLKAALNMALADRLVATDAGWKTVIAFERVGRGRQLFLGREQREKLIEACPADLRELVQGLMLTALRPGELAAADVGDFDKVQGTLNIRKSKTVARIVPLSTAAVKFFGDLTRERIGAHPLVADAFGARWDKDKWKKPFKAAAKAAELPADAVLYSLRHSAISELLIGGMEIHTVARIAGTSSDMIDKHYGHLCIQRTRERLDAVKLG